METPLRRLKPNNNKYSQTYFWETPETKDEDDISFPLSYEWDSISNRLRGYSINGIQDFEQNPTSLEEADAIVNRYHAMSVVRLIESLEEKIESIKESYYDNSWP